METISPRPPTRTTGATPPVTPFSIAVPHAYVLPPLKTLPTWNRNKFKDGNHLRPVQKNKNSNFKVELIGRIEQIENCTQTSPVASFSLEPPVEVLSKESNICNHGEVVSKQCAKGSNELRQSSYDKKIVFLETIHKEVLSSLHQELDTVKSQNKALKFQLVMSSEREPKVPSEDSEDAEIRQLKKLLCDADSKNIYLTKLIEQLRTRSSEPYPGSGHAGTKTDRRRNSSLKKKLKHVKLNIDDVDTYGESSHRSEEKLSNTKTFENYSEEKHDYIGSTIAFPKLNSRSAPIKNTNCPVTNPSYKKEPISLPVLQTLPAMGNRNFTTRQKRAKALHVQRQRSNKNLTLLTAAIGTDNINP